MDLSEIYDNKSGIAYAAIMPIILEDEFDFKKIYFVAITDEDNINEISKYLNSNTVRYYLEGIFPAHAIELGKMKPKEYRILNKINNEVYV